MAEKVEPTTAKPEDRAQWSSLGGGFEVAAGAGSDAPACVIPSVLELAKHHRTLWTVAGAFDEIRTRAKEFTPAYRNADVGYDLARNESLAIDGLIFSRQIVTIADAAALAVHGYERAERCEGSPRTDDMVSLKDAFGRLAFLLIHEAKLNPDDLGCGGTYEGLRRTVGLPEEEQGA